MVRASAPSFTASGRELALSPKPRAISLTRGQSRYATGDRPRVSPYRGSANAM